MPKAKPGSRVARKLKVRSTVRSPVKRARSLESQQRPHYFNAVDPVQWQHWMRGHQPDPLGDEPSRIIIVDMTKPNWKLPDLGGDALVNDTPKRSLTDFVGLVPGDYDVMDLQRQTRRARS